ncbi:polyprotein [Purpureocillium lilacinum]|uniref:Polyprotein n=1 Tax=Purpureocillium lilacinum TaxID=33203 RepID=A0A179EWX5_PURLI|nr:polyprotein [Purpureocillium lilacinum]
MSDNNASSKRVMLQTFEDWGRWDEEFQTKATSLHLWGVIDPDSDEALLEKPDRPEFGDYYRRIPARTTESESQTGRQTRHHSSHTLSQPSTADPIIALPETIDINHRARNLSELTADDRAAFMFEWRIYEQDYREYKEQETNSEKLKAWVTDTVDYGLRQSFMPPHVGSAEVQTAARRKYQAATAPLTKVPKDFAGWITTWEMATNHALVRRTGGVEDPNTWFDDLTKAIQPILASWVAIYAGIYKEKLEEKTLTIGEVAKDLRKEAERRNLLQSSGKGSRIQKGVFGPTFAGEPPSPTQQGPEKQGYWWDSRPEFNCLRTRNNSVLCLLTDKNDQFIIEDDHDYLEPEKAQGAFVTRRRNINSWTERSPSKADARKWHLRLGHPGPQALEHLVNMSRGAKIKGPTTTECEDCAVSKITRQVRRETRDTGNGPGERLAIDFHDLPRDPDQRSSVMLITDRWSGYVWDYYLVERRLGTIHEALKDLLGTLEHQHQLRPRVIECDNEIQKDKSMLSTYLQQRYIRLEPSAPNTPAQNGGAETTGRIIKTKARAMRTGARLPEHLWVEIYKAAVYLYNRTPRYISSWQSPYERLHTFLARRDGIVVESRKPQQAHLRVYGCKAYAMTREAQLGLQKRQKLNPRAWIGFLVGYQSTNIYRVWNPRTGKVISTRDVIFNEDERFNGDMQQLKDDLLHIGREELMNLLDQVEMPETERNAMIEEDQSGAHISQMNWEGLHGEDEDVENQLSWNDPVPHGRARDTEAEQLEVGLDHPTETDEGFGTPGVKEADRYITEGGTEDQPEGGADDQAKNSEDRSRPYPTPVSLPPAVLLSMAIREGSSDSLEERFKPCSSHQPFEVWKAAFVAGRLASPVGSIHGKTIDKAKFQRLLKNPKSLHRRDMPSLPRGHSDLDTHPMGHLFKEAEVEHLRSHDEMKSWTEILRQDPQARGNQILDCMWVYVYKFDKHGRFQKCKARLVVGPSGR